MEAEIRNFLTENFPLGDDPGQLAPDASLLEAGVIDSTGVLELVGFLEQTYGIRIEDDELLPENLDTINGIVAFVEQKRAAASAA
jgi:acyl carrier protein